MAAALPNTDEVHKITILPRGRALGYTMVLPEEDKFLMTRNEMLDQLAYCWAAASPRRSSSTTPPPAPANDIEKATTVARQMVTSTA